MQQMKLSFGALPHKFLKIAGISLQGESGRLLHEGKAEAATERRMMLTAETAPATHVAENTNDTC